MAGFGALALSTGPEQEVCLIHEIADMPSARSGPGTVMGVWKPPCLPPKNPLLPVVTDTAPPQVVRFSKSQYKVSFFFFFF